MNKLIVITTVCLCGLNEISLAQNAFPSSGNVGVGTTTPSFPLHVVAPANNWKGWFSGSDGYISIGPANPSWAHIYTDRPNFIFNQNVWSITGGFSSYSSADLSLQTNGTPRLSISNSTGNVGIGTTAPEGRLTVSQVGNGWYDGLRINRDASNYLTLTEDVTDIRLKNWGTGGILFFTSTSQPLTILNGGNVGIGTTTPDSKLSVKGTIHTQEVKVDLNGSVAPDYVFEKDYVLTSLEKLKSYIDQNKHLPEIPSAKEMEQEGINLKEMNLKLLQKIEELTLHIINQEQRIQKLEKDKKE